MILRDAGEPFEKNGARMASSGSETTSEELR
jgi:hypothetical protein